MDHDEYKLILKEYGENAVEAFQDLFEYHSHISLVSALDKWKDNSFRRLQDLQTVSNGFVKALGNYYDYQPKPRPMTFEEAIKFVRANPRYEIKDDLHGDIMPFLATWYNEINRTIQNKDEIEDLKWREEPGKEWKEFTTKGE